MLEEIDRLLDLYNLNSEEKEEFKSIINPIIEHNEFIKRYDNNTFPHHGDISLGKHIISDAILTYVVMKRKKKYQNLNIRLAVIIAMFHDLYELPWQNNLKKKKFINKHGFTHPIEAVINSITWYPEYFENEEEAKIIIDGIMHHMFPFPVRSIKTTIDDLDLNNSYKYLTILENYKNIVVDSSKRKMFLNLSFSRSLYKEGRIMSNADKKIALNKELKSFKSLKSCVTGKYKRNNAK